LHEAIRWSVFAGGKRIRPAMVFATGRVFGADQSRLVKTAAAVEMIHTYSLIHDDLPSMDDDDMRRGRAACHRQFGEATAILAGDALQALAFQTIAADESLSAEVRVRIVSLLAVNSGTPRGMVSGQQRDLDAEGKMLDPAQIAEIHSQKTGALISAAILAGGIIGGAEEWELVSLNDYAAQLGLLFQITDDLLDATAPTAVLGKTAGKDAASGKATLINNGGIETATRAAREVHENACRAIAAISRNTSPLRALATFVLERRS